MLASRAAEDTLVTFRPSMQRPRFEPALNFMVDGLDIEEVLVDNKFVWINVFVGEMKEEELEGC
jgi:hypothetical protein